MQNNLSLLKNDIKTVSVQRDTVLHKITLNAEFTFSFFLLLAASTIICSLGLLIGSAPVIIGGMIISPLMWPLLKIAIGISLGKKKIVMNASVLFILSFSVAFFVAFFITFLSPIKATNPEIFARTQPTILDLIVALAAGSIAALAVAEKKISDSLAGVAIATSLMPPLCVSGIGLALIDPAIASSAFLLFLSNVIAIIFAAALVFLIIGLTQRKGKVFTWEAFILLAVVSFLISIPLFTYFTNYSLKVTAHQVAQEVLDSSFSEIDHLISVQNVKTTVAGNNDSKSIVIDADIVIPENIQIDYEQKQKIINALEKKLNRKISLNLRVQKTIALASEETKAAGIIQNTVTNTFYDILEQRTGDFSINAIDTYYDADRGEWIVKAILIADPTANFTEAHRAIIEELLTAKIGQKVAVDIDLLSRIKLKSQPNILSEQIRQDVLQFFGVKSDISVASLTIVVPEEESDTAFVQIKINIIVPQGTTITQLAIDQLKRQLEEKYNKRISIMVEVTEKNIYTY